MDQRHLDLRDKTASCRSYKGERSQVCEFSAGRGSCVGTVRVRVGLRFGFVIGTLVVQLRQGLEVQLERFWGNPCGSGPIFVDGIEFRHIDNVECEERVDISTNADSSIYWDQQPSSDFQEIMKRWQYDVLTMNKQELDMLLSTGVLIDNGEKLFSLSKMNRKKYHMLPAKAVINKYLNAEYSKCQPSATSRFVV
uniref:Phloem protein 2-like protein n=1 Tax=Tanacetum cinerariifolium TaxID=118510 RepID=A0A6L2LYY1_TANCI|nr:phloem protein 2-like protein [Tanacetum cinerariifolium]